MWTLRERVPRSAQGTSTAMRTIDAFANDVALDGIAVIVTVRVDEFGRLEFSSSDRHASRSAGAPAPPSAAGVTADGPVLVQVIVRVVATAPTLRLSCGTAMLARSITASASVEASVILRPPYARCTPAV